MIPCKVRIDADDHMRDKRLIKRKRKKKKRKKRKDHRFWIYI